MFSQPLGRCMWPKRNRPHALRPPAEQMRTCVDTSPRIHRRKGRQNAPLQSPLWSVTKDASPRAPVIDDSETNARGCFGHYRGSTSVWTRTVSRARGSWGHCWVICVRTVGAGLAEGERHISPTWAAVRTGTAGREVVQTQPS